MFERQVRLLYRTTCSVCGDGVPAGTITWWDGDRRHATCTTCFVDLDPFEAELEALTELDALDGLREAGEVDGVDEVDGLDRLDALT